MAFFFLGVLRPKVDFDHVLQGRRPDRHPMDPHGSPGQLSYWLLIRSLSSNEEPIIDHCLSAIVNVAGATRLRCRSPRDGAKTNS